jgi:hypothetical protein
MSMNFAISLITVMSLNSGIPPELSQLWTLTYLWPQAFLWTLAYLWSQACSLFLWFN